MESLRLTSLSNRRSTSGVDKREVQDVLVGNLAVQHNPVSRTIRLYISSGWTDSQVEKRHLFSQVIPSLRHFCQTLGLQFHAIDLFSAIPTISEGTVCNCNSSTGDSPAVIEDTLLCELERQGSLRLVAKEIELCQRVSAGPSFVTLLAQKYGYKTLLSTIPEEDFNLLLAAMEDTASKTLIQTWYKLDYNAQPYTYVLQSSTDAGVSLKEWIDIHELLSKTICRAAKIALGKDVSKVQRYTMSVVEEEATTGIFNLRENPNRFCLWFKRTFSDLMDQRPTSDPALCVYTDLTVGRKGLEFDMEALKTLNHLKEARMTAKYIGLDSTNIMEFSLKWQKNKGLDPAENTTHEEYLSELAESVQSMLTQMITDTADLLKVQSGSPVYQEALCHGQYCQERASTFWERPDITSQIYQYIVSDTNLPLVLHGVTGSGKTSIMAEVAYRMKEKYPLTKMMLVIRFIGITPSSFNVRCTLRSICEQITTVLHGDLSDIPGDYKAIAKHFEILLTKATKETPIYLFLDGVDRLSPDDGASGMSWLPLSLPPNAKIILSTSSEVKYRCFPVLQSLMSHSQQNFIKISPLNLTECRDFMRHVLASQGRQLTITQEEKALKAATQYPFPLYLDILLKDLKSWNSYDQEKWEILPPDTLEELCEQFICALEEEFGHCFVSRVLGYITATKHGLSEMELLDILASDTEVMQQLNTNWRHRYAKEVSSLLQVPPLLWSRFYHKLLPFLELRMGVGQTLVFQWSCRPFADVVTKHYLPLESSTTNEIFLRLADYFNGTSVQDRSLSVNESTPPLMSVAVKQPVMLNEEEKLWNIRKLTELPYCLARCGKMDKLKQLLTNYEWLNACIHTMPCADIINWFSDVIPVVPLGRSDQGSDESDELRLLRDALCLSIPVLNLDPSQLSAQLLSRLMPYVTDSETERPFLKQLVMTALELHPPLLTPLHPSFCLPGGPLLVTMEGHRDVISYIATVFSRDKETGKCEMCILSSSWDKTLKTWDLKSTGVMKTFDGHTDRVLSAALSGDAQYAVSGSDDKSVRHWYVPTGECMQTMTGHTGSVNAVLISNEGSKTVSGSSDATVKVWNSDPSSNSYGQLIYTMRNSRSQVLSMSWCDALNIAIGYKDGRVRIVNIVSAETLQTFQGQAGGITTLAYVKLTNGCHYLATGSEQDCVEIRQVDTGETLHTLELKTGPIRSVSMAENGKVTAAHGDRMVSVWDVESGSYLYNLDGNSSAVHSTGMSDGGNLAVTGSADFSIRIWDLKSPPVSQITRYHQKDVVAVTVSPCGYYGASGSQDASIIIYDLDTMAVLKHLQGHQGSVNCVAVLRDSKHLLSSSADGSVNLWNGETEELLRTYHDDTITGGVNCIAISADSELLMSGSEHGEVAFWSVKTGKLLKTFTDHKSAVVSVAFAEGSTNKYIISASRYGLVRVRDFYTAKILLSKETHTDDLLCLAVSPDTTMFATGSKDKECHVINLPNGSFNAVLAGHRGSVQSVVIIQGGKMSLTASEDCTLRLWDVARAECIATLYADLPILCCDIDRHERNILYGTKDGWVSTALYHDPSLRDADTDQNPVVKKLKGIKSPSTSSFSETDSSISQSSMMMNTETHMQPVPVSVVDASLIPLPPSDDKSPVGNGSLGSPSSSLEMKYQDNTQDIGGVALNPPTTDIEMDETTTTQYKKLSPEQEGFVEPTISTIMKIKSEIGNAGDRESLHSIHEDHSDSDSVKSKSTPQTSSMCTML